MSELDEDGVVIEPTEDNLMYDFEVSLKSENARLRAELAVADETAKAYRRKIQQLKRELKA